MTGMRKEGPLSYLSSVSDTERNGLEELREVRQECYRGTLVCVWVLKTEKALFERTAREMKSTGESQALEEARRWKECAVHREYLICLGTVRL